MGINGSDINFVGSATGYSYTPGSNVSQVTVDVPAGVANGDLMVACMVVTTLSNPSSSSFEAQSGWTEIVNQGPGSPDPGGSALYYRIADNEPASYTFLLNGYTAGEIAAFIAVYSGLTSTPLDAYADSIASSSSATYTTPTVTATATPEELVLYVASLGGTSSGSTGAAQVSASTYTVNTRITNSADGFTLGLADTAVGPAGTAPGTVTWTTAAGTSLPWLGAAVTFKAAASAPNAPTLTAPANASYLDVASGVTLTGTYNSTDSANQNAYACRIKVSGASSYSYYNASTNALQSTIVWNPDSVAPGGSFNATLPSSAVSDGNTYNWSLASQESGANLQGPFAADFTFNAQAAPVLTVNGPSGTTTTANPLVTWTTTPPSGASQTAYQVIVESGSYGTVPGSGTQAWNSGVVASSAQSATVGTALTNQTTYRAFVQVTETGGQTSSWKYTTFTASFDPPGQPTVTATPGTDPSTGCPVITVAVQGRDNLLSLNDASFEGSLGTWTAGANTSIADSTAEALDGSYSMTLTATAAGNVAASTGLYAL